MPCVAAAASASWISGSTSTPSSGSRASRSAAPPSSQCAAAVRAACSGVVDARRDRRAAAGAVEERQLGGAVAEHRHAERLEQLGGRRHVEQRLDPGGDDERRRARELRQVGGDVGPLGEAAVDAADPAGAHEADPGEPRGRERAADRGRAELAARHAGGEVARPGLARVGSGLAEALELAGVEPDHDLAVEHADRCGHGPFGPDRGLGGRDPPPPPPREGTRVRRA